MTNKVVSFSVLRENKGDIDAEFLYLLLVLRHGKRGNISTQVDTTTAVLKLRLSSSVDSGDLDQVTIPCIDRKFEFSLSVQRRSPIRQLVLPLQFLATLSLSFS